MSRLWEKGLPLHDRVLRYTAGEDHRLDDRLVPHDVRASIAHASMLRDQGYLEPADCEAICTTLTELQQEFANGDWQIELEDEDVHTALEKRLTERLGETGGRIHLGRSRNDQVLTALRLYLLVAGDEIRDAVEVLISALGELTERDGEVFLPGTTHMQHAMPSSVALWAGAFHEAFADAVAGLESARRRLQKNPLGSAAGYGTPGLALDRDATTQSLGFSETQTPVTAVQLSRGKAESALVFELSLLMQDLGRLASDLLLYYTQEFGYVELGADVTTGSSIMPQKRNPDVLELVRGATATVHACLSECLMLSAKLPSGFQRDLQRMKAPLFRAIDISVESCEVMALVLSRVRFCPEKIAGDSSLDAAAEAYHLVTSEGLPFREAYRRVAKKYAG